MNWNDWIELNTNKLYHTQGFEVLFVERILVEIKTIKPQQVICQYHFKDSRNKNRYIDFVIEDKFGNKLLAIELDGTYKDADHDKWSDFLDRQNDLLNKFNTLLRFSNKDILTKPKDVIDSITNKIESEIIKIKEREKTEENHNKLKDELFSKEQKHKIEIEKEQQYKTDLLKVNDRFELKFTYINIFSILFLLLFISFYYKSYFNEQVSNTVLHGNSSVLNTITPELQIGQNITLCEEIVSLTPFSKGNKIKVLSDKLNVNFVIWNDLLPQITNKLDGMKIGTNICAKGYLSKFREEYQIIISDERSIYILNH